MASKVTPIGPATAILVAVGNAAPILSTIGEFVADNAEAVFDIIDVQIALAHSGLFRTGGGAQPVVDVRLAS
jgi:hypothetical protein